MSNAELLLQTLESSGVPVATVALGRDHEYVDLVEVLSKAAGDAAAVFVTGLESLVLLEDGQLRAAASLSNLNQRRDLLPAELSARIVFWVSSDRYPVFAAVAWDLCQVMLVSVEFRGGDLPGYRPRMPTTTTTHADARARVLFITTGDRKSREREQQHLAAIERSIGSSPNRTALTFVHRVLQTWVELPDLLRQHRPTIVHLLGHGELDGTLLLIDAQHDAIAAEPLAEIFARFTTPPTQLRCVFMAQAYSSASLEALARAGVSAIGFRGSLGEQTMIAFSARFYSAFAATNDLERAFALAQRSLALSGDYADSPILIHPA